MVEGDVIPFSSVVGARGKLSGLNLVGLKRRSFKRDDIKLLRQVYRLLFAPEGTFTERLREVKEVFGNKPLANEILNFLNNNSHRSIVHRAKNSCTTSLSASSLRSKAGEASWLESFSSITMLCHMPPNTGQTLCGY